eukprot:scaffold300715_cov17-Prasinocladus_malaysianus.AAC.1
MAVHSDARSGGWAVRATSGLGRGVQLINHEGRHPAEFEYYPPEPRHAKSSLDLKRCTARSFSRLLMPPRLISFGHFLRMFETRMIDC